MQEVTQQEMLDALLNFYGSYEEEVRSWAEDVPADMKRCQKAIACLIASHAEPRRVTREQIKRAAFGHIELASNDIFQDEEVIVLSEIPSFLTDLGIEVKEGNHES